MAKPEGIILSEQALSHLWSVTAQGDRVRGQALWQISRPILTHA